MSSGDQHDAVSRLWSVIPPSWFPSGAPNVTTLLTGFANVASYIYGLISFAKLQTRLETVQGIFLDLFTLDYLARTVRRRAGERDPSLRMRTRRAILQERASRPGMTSAIKNLVGRVPAIIEPWNTRDCGALNSYGLALAGATIGLQNGAGLAGEGYHLGIALGANNGCIYIPPQQAAYAPGAGAVGSYQMNGQVFLTVPPVMLAAIPNVAGLASDYAGLGSNYLSLIGDDDLVGAISVHDIYNEINNTKPVGVTVWTNIQGASSLPQST